jgi:hypothetical protein
VKWEGKGLVDLKFLGLKWNRSKLSSETRSGNTLWANSIKKAYSVITDWYKNNTILEYSVYWETIFKNKFGEVWGLNYTMDIETWKMFFVIPVFIFFFRRYFVYEITRKKKIKNNSIGVRFKAKNIDLFNFSSYSSFALVRILRIIFFF